MIGDSVVWFLGLYLGGKMYEFRGDYYKMVVGRVGRMNE
jgi:hypothetical protein